MHMKQYTALFIAFSFLLCSLTACTGKSYEDGYTDGYSEAKAEMDFLLEEEFLDGYDFGYEDGYHEGIDRAQSSIESQLDDELWSLAHDIEDKYGIHPEEAVQILSMYADVPEEVTEEDLIAAIWAIYRYYYASNEAVGEIDDYWID